MNQGGVVPKKEVSGAGAAGAAAEAARAKAAAAARAEGVAPLTRAPVRLCVEDPLTGRDVASGSHRINQASRRECLAAGQRQLSALCCSKAQPVAPSSLHNDSFFLFVCFTCAGPGCVWRRRIQAGAPAEAGRAAPGRLPAVPV